MKTTDAGGMVESDWEVFALEQLAELDWKPMSGHDIAPGSGERDSWEGLHIPARMFNARRRLNPHVPNEYLQQALVDIVAPASNDAIAENYRVHGWLTSGFRGITYIDEQGQDQTPMLHLVSTDPDENEWLAANQVTVRHGDLHRRFDLVLYCNGIPVVIIELKKAGDLGADPAAAHAQLQTYLHEPPDRPPTPQTDQVLEFIGTIAVALIALASTQLLAHDDRSRATAEADLLSKLEPGSTPHQQLEAVLASRIKRWYTASRRQLVFDVSWPSLIANLLLSAAVVAAFIYWLVTDRLPW